MSYEKFLTLPPSYLTEEYDGDEESEDDGDEVETTKAPAARGRRRSKGVPMGTQTKHDADICGRRNVKNMEKVRKLVTGFVYTEYYSATH